MIKKLNVNKGLFTSLLMIPAITFTGCGKSDCDLKEYHLHKYEKDGFVRYIDDEHLDNDGYSWTDEVIYINESDKKIYEFERKKDLIKITDNKDNLVDTVSSMDDYIEYEYSYKVPHHIRTGKVTVTTYSTSYAWTTDSEHGNLTGDVRLCRYFYTGYKAVLNEKGKYELVEGITSESINDIIENCDEYPYMKVNFYDSKVIAEGKVDESGQPCFEENNKIYKKEK